MAGLDPAIHVLADAEKKSRGCAGQARMTYNPVGNHRILACYRPLPITLARQGSDAQLMYSPSNPSICRPASVTSPRGADSACRLIHLPILKKKTKKKNKKKKQPKNNRMTRQ